MVYKKSKTNSFFLYLGKTPLGDPIPCDNGNSNGNSNGGSVNPNARDGQSCCCAGGNFCPNPSDFGGDSGFVSKIYYFNKNKIKKFSNK